DSCRSNFLPFYHHPPHAFLLPRSLSRRWRRSPKLPCPFTGRRPVLGFAHPTQARHCIRPYRVHHCFIYGLAVHLRLPPTPPFDDAVSFDYGQPVFCPMGLPPHGWCALSGARRDALPRVRRCTSRRSFLLLLRRALALSELRL